MQGRLGAATRRSGGGDNSKALRLLINPPRWSLDDRTVIFQYTGNGGWFCASFGEGAKYMHAADNDAVLCRRIEARAQEIRRHRDALGPDLARVMAAVELAKDYDPDQPRDDHGRWTSEGAAAVAGVAGGTALMYASAVYADGLQEIGARVLGAAARALPVAANAVVDGVAGAALPAAAFFGTLFVPTPRNLVASDGTMSDARDYSYHFDQEAGHLTIKRQLSDGTSETVFDGGYGKDAVFRDDQGNAIGRFLGDSVALDADAVRGYEARRRSDAQAPPGAIAQTDTATRSEPKLCLDVTEENIAGRKERGSAYQSQISGLPPVFDFKLPDPAGGFDACWEEKDGTMGEAKGPGYAERMVGPDDWQDWYEGDEEIEDQMARQSSAAAGRQVEWYFAEKEVADFFRGYVEENRVKLPNIQVFYTPPAR
jgi:hypothetical protein